MDRRAFLRTCLATGGLGLLPPASLAALQHPATQVQRWDRILVLIELKGGNDGLNTVVPLEDSNYQRLRPKLALKPSETLPLDNGLYLNRRLSGVHEAWQAGEAGWLLGVGYPNPNRSHFRSIEIWETASAVDEYLRDGWYTRLLKANPRPEGLVADAIVLGGGSPGPAKGRGIHVLSMHGPAQFLRLSRLAAEPEGEAGNSALAHIHDLAQGIRDARALLAKLSEAAPKGPAHEFPNTPIGRQLSAAAELIRLGRCAPLLKLTHGGFDTHTDQKARHARLLTELDQGLTAFRREMQEAQLWDRVLVMTYSEFGRRAAENASGGTDHGAASCQLLMGGTVGNGFWGQYPSLGDLDRGDLEATTDFRGAILDIAGALWGIDTRVVRQGAQIGFEEGTANS